MEKGTDIFLPMFHSKASDFFNHSCFVVCRSLCSHVELPFYWQIIKPNPKPLIPGETGDFTKLECNGDTESAFSLTPEQGVLLPQGDHEFVLTYTPQQVKLMVPS